MLSLHNSCQIYAIHYKIYAVYIIKLYAQLQPNSKNLQKIKIRYAKICKNMQKYAKNMQKICKNCVVSSYYMIITPAMLFEVSFQSLAVQLKPKTH